MERGGRRCLWIDEFECRDGPSSLADWGTWIQSMASGPREFLILGPTSSNSGASPGVTPSPMRERLNPVGETSWDRGVS